MSPLSLLFKVLRLKRHKYVLFFILLFIVFNFSCNTLISNPHFFILVADNVARLLRVPMADQEFSFEGCGSKQAIGFFGADVGFSCSFLRRTQKFYVKFLSIYRILIMDLEVGQSHPPAPPTHTDVHGSAPVEY